MRHVRRIGVVVALVVIAAMSFGSAGAAPAQTQHFRFHGTIADAEWVTESASGFVDTFVTVSKSKTGQDLFVDQFASTATGFTEVSAVASEGFSFSAASQLRTATLTASNLPATICTFDSDFNLIACNDTTINVSVTWTGQGAVARETFNDHFRNDGFSSNFHFNGTSRNAVASGTVAGRSLTADELLFADIARVNNGAIDRCVGAACA
jgi:hypothetical protein